MTLQCIYTCITNGKFCRLVETFMNERRSRYGEGRCVQSSTLIYTEVEMQIKIYARLPNYRH